GGSTTMTANLPIKIHYYNTYAGTKTIKYDDKDRFIEILDRENNKFENVFFTYENDTLTQIKTVGNTTYEVLNTTITFTYVKDIIYVQRKTEGYNTTNMDKLKIDQSGMLLSIVEDTRINRQFFYDSNGNMTKWIDLYAEEADLTYNSTNGIFKNVNLPQWAKYYTMRYISYFFVYSLMNNIQEINYSHNAFNPEKYIYQYNSQMYPEFMGRDNQYYYEIEYSK